MRLALAVASLIVFIGQVNAGPIMYGICLAGCNATAATCYAAAGTTFATIAALLAPFLAPATIFVCNSALATCSASCTAAFFYPWSM
ncbi:hypothetical protein BKA70DRAFT_1310482, partial [Coprinopsis sp. MPI-PUGE-AT-0042]